MKITLEVTKLENHGDQVLVRGQGRGIREATWRDWQIWEFTVPDYIGNRYRLGQELTIQVTI